MGQGYPPSSQPGLSDVAPCFHFNNSPGQSFHDKRGVTRFAPDVRSPQKTADEVKRVEGEIVWAPYGVHYPRMVQRQLFVHAMLNSLYFITNRFLSA